MIPADANGFDELIGLTCDPENKKRVAESKMSCSAPLKEGNVPVRPRLTRRVRGYPLNPLASD